VLQTVIRTPNFHSSTPCALRLTLSYVYCQNVFPVMCTTGRSAVCFTTAGTQHRWNEDSTKYRLVVEKSRR
ncbi:hypothetical protein PFISCL1PPCAC_22214, partial [Pristionchus fissidentatus]